MVPAHRDVVVYYRRRGPGRSAWLVALCGVLIWPIAVGGWLPTIARGAEPISPVDALLSVVAENAVVEETSQPDNSATQDPNQLSESATVHHVAVIHLSGAIPEVAAMDDPFRMPGETGGLYEIVERFRQASKDDSLSGVIVSLEEPWMTWSQVDELRQAITNVRKSGKRVFAYTETADQLTYLLAAACDEIVLTPTGHVELMGLSAHMVYVKELLDRLGLSVDIVQIGRYKGAAEPFTRSWPSDEETEQLESLLDGLYKHLVDSILSPRFITRADTQRHDIREWIDRGLFSAEQAHDRALVDHLYYRPEFLAYLNDGFDGPVVLHDDYGETTIPAMNTASPFAMMSLFEQWLSPQPLPGGEIMALVPINGPIVTGESYEGLSGPVIGSTSIRLALDEARREPRIKAVVIRIDSPGGSATASDILYHAIRRTAEVKPVVVSLGAVAASGGYYAAVGAPTILIQPSTITGSIGVFGGKLVVADLLERLGIHSVSFTRGASAELFSSMRPFTPAERLTMMTMMEATYADFKHRVEQSRGERLVRPIEQLAQGRIYSGHQAVELGLADMIGGLDQAINVAADKADLDTYQVVILPRPRTIIEMIEDFFAAAAHDDSSPRALAGLQRLACRSATHHSASGALSADPTAQLAGTALLWYHTLKQERVLTASPWLLFWDQ